MLLCSDCPSTVCLECIGSVTKKDMESDFLCPRCFGRRHGSLVPYLICFSLLQKIHYYCIQGFVSRDKLPLKIRRPFPHRTGLRVCAIPEHCLIIDVCQNPNSYGFALCQHLSFFMRNKVSYIHMNFQLDTPEGAAQYDAAVEKLNRHLSKGGELERYSLFFQTCGCTKLGLRQCQPYHRCPLCA